MVRLRAEGLARRVPLLQVGNRALVLRVLRLYAASRAGVRVREARVVAVVLNVRWRRRLARVVERTHSHAFLQVKHIAASVVWLALVLL